MNNLNITEKMISQMSDEDLAFFDEDCNECICCIAKNEKQKRNLTEWKCNES